MNVLALICARGGSKGLPGKNTRSLAGRPLITRAIDQACAVQRVSRVIVSTDSEKIARVARESGAEVPFLRPAELAQDDSPEWLVWRHALSVVQESGSEIPDALLVVPATAPMRAVDDLERCLDEFETGRADVVITVTDAQRSPYFNMVSPQPDGTVRVVIPPDVAIVRRQDVPDVFDVTTVGYVAKPDLVARCDGMFEGRVRSVHVPRERALDIDTLFDFRLAEFMMAAREE